MTLPPRPSSSPLQDFLAARKLLIHAGPMPVTFAPPWVHPDDEDDMVGPMAGFMAVALRKQCQQEREKAVAAAAQRQRPWPRGLGRSSTPPASPWARQQEADLALWDSGRGGGLLPQEIVSDMPITTSSSEDDEPQVSAGRLEGRAALAALLLKPPHRLPVHPPAVAAAQRVACRSCNTLTGIDDSWAEITPCTQSCCARRTLRQTMVARNCRTWTSCHLGSRISSSWRVRSRFLGLWASSAWGCEAWCGARCHG